MPWAKTAEIIVGPGVVLALTLFVWRMLFARAGRTDSSVKDLEAKVEKEFVRKDPYFERIRSVEKTSESNAKSNGSDHKALFELHKDTNTKLANIDKCVGEINAVVTVEIKSIKESIDKMSLSSG